MIYLYFQFDLRPPGQTSWLPGQKEQNADLKLVSRSKAVSTDLFSLRPCVRYISKLNAYIVPQRTLNIKFIFMYRVLIKYYVFPRILKSLPPHPRQHSAAISYKKNYHQIGVTVHSHCIESFEGLLQRCRRVRGCGEL